MTRVQGSVPLLPFFYLHYHTLGTNDTITYKVSSSDSFYRFQANEGGGNKRTFAKYNIFRLFMVYCKYCKLFMYKDKRSKVKEEEECVTMHRIKQHDSASPEL